jgi:hypothetical protein
LEQWSDGREKTEYWKNEIMEKSAGLAVVFTNTPTLQYSNGLGFAWESADFPG